MANQLKHETSPYLLQHADNPVHWYAWNEDTLALAKNEDKMLLISIGYAACHWCHVMARESFQDAAVADVMNAHFICIKVDREERPDVDHIYMDAAYLVNGSGGWPLNALALPDGRPFFAGTYFNPENWVRLLTFFAEAFANERSRLEAQADSLARGIRDIEHVPKVEEDVLFTSDDVEEMAANVLKKVDWEHGGIQGNMKFPMPSVWRWLLHYYSQTKDSMALDAVEKTLTAIAEGGLYDQVGGGFARYTTDREWHIPHFEKMLYDNAQLVVVYAEAYLVTGSQLYRRVAMDTIRFVERELMHTAGGFYSSLNAESEGEEGAFYVWKLSEIESILGKEDAALYASWYGISASGNWEQQKNIPDIRMGMQDIHNAYGVTEEELILRIQHLNETLLQARAKRPRPSTDDKVLTSWNALMIQAYIAAWKAFKQEDYLHQAKKQLNFILDKMARRDGGVFRNYTNQKSSIPAFLDDYALLISACIDFYQISFDETYLNHAQRLSDYVHQHFYDPNTSMYFYTDTQFSNLIARKTETTDHVIPSSNSELAICLFQLGTYFDQEETVQIAIQMLKNMKKDVLSNPVYYSNWGRLLLTLVRDASEVAVMGPSWHAKLSDLQKHYLPDVLFFGGEKSSLPLAEGKSVPGATLLYLCRNKTCTAPVDEVRKLMNQLQNG